MTKLVHIFYSDTEKYSIRFRSDVTPNLTEIEHEFWYSKKSRKKPLGLTDLIKVLRSDDYVVFHGLYFQWWQTFIITLFITFNLINVRRLIWFPWGADVYNIVKGKKISAAYVQYLFRRTIISYVDIICTAFQGEMKYIKEHYNTAGYWHQLGYHVPIYNIQPNIFADNKISILIGNSCDPSNRHGDAIDITEDIIQKSQSIVSNRVHYVFPLAHGSIIDRESAILDINQRLLPNKYTILEDFIATEAYFKLLSKSNISIFLQQRQQAVGTILLCLIVGHAVILNSQSPVYHKLKDLGLPVYETEEIEYVIHHILEIQKQHSANQSIIIEIIVNEFGIDGNLIKWQEMINKLLL